MPEFGLPDDLDLLEHDDADELDAFDRMANTVAEEERA